jgi:hypothetical protein
VVARLVQTSLCVTAIIKTSDRKVTYFSMSCTRKRFARPRALFFVPVVLTLGAIVSGCANTPPPPCPPVRVDSATATMTKFNDGASQDLSNVDYQVEIVGFKGECVFTDGKVEVILDLDFRITSGPAAQAGPISFYYFAAVPQYFPQPSGKKVFEIQSRLTGGATRPMSLTESDVSVEIPLSKERPAASFDVYLGLQLSDDQLEFNRRSLTR